MSTGLTPSLFPSHTRELLPFFLSLFPHTALGGKQVDCCFSFNPFAMYSVLFGNA